MSGSEDGGAWGADFGAGSCEDLFGGQVEPTQGTADLEIGSDDSGVWGAEGSSIEDLHSNSNLAQGTADSGAGSTDDTFYTPDTSLLPDFSLLPKTPGTYLGLDISKSSTGVALVTHLGYESEQLVLNADKSSPHYEALLRRDLRNKLIECIGEGVHFTGIAVEDVYLGSNPKTIRMLMALNSVIDDLILDGIITCDTFSRVSNGTWRKQLRQAVPSYSKALNEKIFVKETLATYGITVTGAGAEDRLDALGIAMSLYLDTYEGEKATGTTTLASLNKIQAMYVNNLVDLEVHPGYRDGIKFTARPTLKNIREQLGQANKGQLYYTPQRVYLGSVVDKLGVESRPFGGFLAFWLK